MASWWQRTKAYFESDKGRSGGMVFVDRGSAGMPKGTRDVLQAAHESPWLRAVVNKIGQHVGSTCWYLFKATKSASRSASPRVLRSMPFEKRRHVLRKAQQNNAIEAIDTHPVLTLLERPTVRFGGVQMFALTQEYLDLVGECFWILERNEKGGVVEIKPVPPTWIKSIPTKEEPFYKLQFGSETRSIAVDDVIWFSQGNLLNPYGRGYGTAQALGDEIDADEHAAQMIKSAFENRGLLDIIVSVEGASEQKLKEVRAQFENRHRGWLKAGVPLFHSGKADVKTVSQSFSEMQLLELRAWERDLIISIYGVPPEILGVITNSNRATITEAQEIFAREVLVPRLEYLRNILNTALVPLFGDDIFLDYEDPTPSADEFRLRAMQANPYSVTAREWRELQGLEDRGERDNYILLPAQVYPFRGVVGVEALPSLEDKPALESVNQDAPELPEPQRMLALPKRKAIDVNALLNTITEQPFQKHVLPVWETELRAAIDDMSEQIDEATQEDADARTTRHIRTKASMIELVAMHLSEFSTYRIKGLVNDTTRRLLQATLMAAVEEQESIPQIAARIQEVFEVNKQRATVIARTEVGRSTNYANGAAMQASGIVEKKEWITAIDGRQRDSHEAMDGQKVPIDKPFVIPAGQNNAGDTAMFPMDFEKAAEVVNCRCTHWPVIEDVRDMTPEHRTELRIARWKAFDSRATAWEHKALPKIQRAFDDQLHAVLTTLDKMR